MRKNGFMGKKLDKQIVSSVKNTFLLLKIFLLLGVIEICNENGRIVEMAICATLYLSAGIWIWIFLILYSIHCEG